MPPRRSGGARPADPGPGPAAEYEVYVNHSSAKRTLLLSYAHKKILHWNGIDDQDGCGMPENSGYQPRPVRLRIKPTAGLVEVDLPLYAPSYYDRSRARNFAQALRKGPMSTGGGDHGMSGGFGTGSTNHTGSLGAGKGLGSSKTVVDGKKKDTLGSDEDEDDENDGLKFVTLGGKVEITSDHDATYMIGMFRDRELHLTPVDAVCMLRPHFHHIDAQTDSERTTGRGGGGWGGGDHGTHDSEARAVNMAVKSTEDEELDMGEVGRTLRSIQEEQWQELNFVDEEDQNSLAIFGSELQLQDEDAKGVRLVSNLTESQYREVAGAPRVEPMNQGKRVLSARPWSDVDDAVEEAEQEDIKPVLPGTAKRKQTVLKEEVDM